MSGLAGHNASARPLRVLLATPYGQDGMGGIDRLNDAIVDGFNNDAALPGHFQPPFHAQAFDARIHMVLRRRCRAIY